jgi:hypothetical protein
VREPPLGPHVPRWCFFLCARPFLLSLQQFELFLHPRSADLCVSHPLWIDDVPFIRLAPLSQR